MLTKQLHRIGLRSWMFEIASLFSITLCVGLWLRAKTIGEDERANAERRVLFVGLCPPTSWLIGDSVKDHE